MPLPQDTTQATGPTAYDTLWAGAEAVPEAAAQGLDGVMLAQDKLYVVLAVVLVIWLGIVLFLYRTDRRLARLERALETGIPEEPTDHDPSK